MSKWTPAAQGTVRAEAISDEALSALRLGVEKSVGLTRVEKTTMQGLLVRLDESELRAAPPPIGGQVVQSIAKLISEGYRETDQTTARKIVAMLSASPSPEALPASGVKAVLYADLLAFVAEEAKSNPVFAKGHGKVRIAEARTLVERAKTLASAPAPEDRT